ncbi:MAG: hypothetical protein SGI71_03965 [Verrucomicrobiota bacterium]|nr:hypothetical protein [Verrucomicrobiota bacterium]
MFEKLLTNDDGCFLWKSDSFTGYTQHYNGQIVWASAMGASHQYYGLEAILRIASNASIVCEPTEDLNMPPNVDGDWDMCRVEIEKQIERGRRFHSRKSKIDKLYVRLVDIPQDLEEGPGKSILQSMPKKTCPMTSLNLEHPELGLWILTDLEMRNIVSIIEPMRVEVPKVAA